MKLINFYIKNYLVVSIIFLIGGITASLGDETPVNILGAILLFIGLVVIPFATYRSWKKKQFRK